MTQITTGPDGQPLFDGMTTEALARAMENDALALGASGLVTPADTLDTAAAALRHLSARVEELEGRLAHMKNPRPEMWCEDAGRYDRGECRWPSCACKDKKEQRP